MSGGPSEIIVKVDKRHDKADATTTPNAAAGNVMNSPAAGLRGGESSAPMQQRGTPTTPDYHEDPPSKLIGVFLNKQRAAGGELRLDVDLEMDEFRHNRNSNYNYNDAPSPSPNFPPLHPNYHDAAAGNRPPFPNSSGILKAPLDHHNHHTPNSSARKVVDICPPDEHDRSWRRHNNKSSSSYSSSSSSSSSSDDDSHTLHNRRRSSNADAQNHSGTNIGSHVLKCTSIQRRVSNLGRMKTKSRLIDPGPEALERRSGILQKSGIMPNKSGNMIPNKSGQMRSSGILGRASGLLGKSSEEEDDDPFDEDIPDEFKQVKFHPLTILQWISLILIVTVFACTLAISRLRSINFRGLTLWKWELLVLVLICGRLVSGWGIRIVVFFIERNFFMRKRVLYFVYGVRKAVQNCIWLGLVLVAWHSMFNREVEADNTFLEYVNRLMVCMLVGILLWLVKTLMVKVLASSFHVSTFFDRIQESLFSQYLIETLSGPPLIEIRNNQEEEERLMAEVSRLQNAGATLPPDLRREELIGGGLPPKPTRGLSFKFSGPLPKSNEQNSESNTNNNSTSLGNKDQGISIEQLQYLNHKNVSAWNMKRLMKVVKHGVITTLDEKALGSAQGDENATQIRSEHEAIVAARNIFRNVAKPRNKFIYLEDLMRFLKEEEALKTLSIVDGSVESEKISKASLKSWVVNTFLERRALALTLNDTKTAVDKLHRMVNIMVGIVIIVLWLIILEIATSKLLVYISSQVIVVAFIFGNTCKTIFEAIIFVFVMHPFDVGDRCEVDGVQMIVEEMNILTTVFLRFDNQKIIYPNVTLATRPISNYYRSPDMGDSVDFAVHIATPAEKIGAIKQRITSYIEDKSEYWYSAPSVVLMNMDDLRTIKFSVWLRHRMNHQNMGERWKRREQLVEEMVKIFREFDIEYRLYPVDINVRDMPSINSIRIPPAWAPPTI